ncbi:hypothetical protein [Streptomyces sp. NPDC001594]|uniref:hypothetical protein n=1 Tax=Streptomyces sp. NPDC001594 TaxID=3364590 RepID=UPI003674DC7B
MAGTSRKKRSSTTKTVGAAAAVMLAGALAVSALTSASAAGADPEDGGTPWLVGTWTGERHVINSATGFFEGPVSLEIKEQRGRTFQGETRYTAANGTAVRKTVVGGFTPERTVMSGANDEGVYTFKLIRRNVLDYCYAEHGGAAVTSCGRLERQK